MLDSDEQPLQFAAASARELHQLFRELWPAATSRHVLRIDGEATWSAIRSDIEGLRGDAFELVLVFVAGHGRRTMNGFSLLLWPDAANVATIAAEDLDAAFARIATTTRLVFLDACYSGTFLQSALALLRDDAMVAGVVASARGNQRSWEDPLLARTLFADAIVRALSAEGAPMRPTVDVLAELCPFVADYVTRHAYALKAGAVQEPIWASVASASLLLPRGRARSRASLTTRQALVRRTRQILVVVAATALALMLAIFATTWRPAINASGFVELRAGPKWLSPLNVGPWAQRVETAIQRSDLTSPDVDPTVVASIQDERGVYPWFGQNRQGLRRWIDPVRSWLTEDAALQWRTRVDDPSLPSALLATGRFGLPTVTTSQATQLAAERALLRDDGTISEAWKRQWREHDFGLPCRGALPLPSDIAERAELFAETTTPEQHAAWIRDLALTARASDDVTFAHVHRLIENFHALHAYTDAKYRATLGAHEPLTARRIARVYDVRPTRLERDALGDLAEAVAMRQLRRAAVPTAAEIRTLFEVDASACGDWAIPALARLGTHGAPLAVSAWAHTRASSDQGRGALAALARDGALPASDAAWILGIYGFGHSYADTKAAVVSTAEWLTAVAEAQPLDPAIAEGFLGFARAAIGRNDLDVAMDALKPVAWSAGRLPRPSRATFLATLRSLRGNEPLALMNDREIELWGIAGARGLSDGDVVRTLFESAIEHAGSPNVVFDQTDDAGRRRLAAGWKLDSVTALARIVWGVDLPPRDRGADVLHFFERTATDGLRAGVTAERLRVIFDALALLQGRADHDAFSGSTLVGTLRTASRDAARRAAIVEVARAHVRALSATDADATVSAYRALWRDEHEPEIKYALALLVIEVTKDFRVDARPR
ncbi:MAG TPA: hypothetical protein VFN10_19310 [Thermoanaerobaculia bacterium]|nr:hypothetical protein [Thermoanaerobaculia bacterium]